MTFRFYRLFLLHFIILFYYGCDSKTKQEAQAPQIKKPQAPVRVDIYIVQTKAESQMVQIPATLVAEDQTEIHPQTSGLITGLYIKEGANVSKGTLLAKLYDADLQAQKKKDMVQLSIYQQTVSRHQQLLKIGGISKEDYETTLLNASNARADLDVLITSINKTEIRAPFNGKLGLKQVSIGAYVTPAAIITTIQKTNAIRIDFNVPEKYASQLKPGDTVRFSTDTKSKGYKAIIFATESGIEQTTRTLKVRARVSGGQEGLIPGGFAKVYFAFDYNPAALMIPTQAIIPQARTKQVILYKNGVASFVNVTTGTRDSSMVEITSGVHKGDSVITTGLMSLKPNARVAARKAVNLSN